MAPETLCEQVSRRLFARTPPEKYATALVAERARYETKTREVKQKKTCNQGSYKKRIRKANRKYKAIDRLIFSRRSPKLVLRELSRILSEAWGPTLKASLKGKDKRTLFNANWDPTSVWITRFEEKGNQLKPLYLSRYELSLIVATSRY